MTLELNDLMVIYPEQIWIELSSQVKQKAWQQTTFEAYSNAAARWIAFMNCLCLDTFVSWLKEDPDFSDKLKVYPAMADLPSIWEFVNGTALSVDTTQLVLIPTEKNNIQEFRIPREWVDIPKWTANYYLAIQLNLAEGWLRVWGYASHEQIREKAKYDPIDQTYCLNKEDLIEDLNVLWVMRLLSPCHKPKVPPLPTLSTTQLDNLLAQLSQWTPNSPRLNFPFEMWGTVLASDKTRQHLYQQRLNNQQRKTLEKFQSPANNLCRWLNNIFDVSWQSLDTLLGQQQTAIAFQFRSDFGLNESGIKAVKIFNLGQLGSQDVMLLVGLNPEPEKKVSIRVQLYPGNGETYLPANLKLIFRSQSGKTLQEVYSRIYDHYIQLKRFKASLGQTFSIQVALGDVSVKEDFVLDPS